jgi:hypothetical protein
VNLSTFIEARNKLEAVARISSLTNSGPEILGPGSKERKSVVINLAKGLNVPISEEDTKQNIAKKISNALGIIWTSDCESAGQTLTLIGLNLLLEAASNRLQPFENSIEVDKLTLPDEINAINKVLIDNTPKNMDGKESVIEMKEADSTKWRQTEWQGFYFEFKILPALINEYGGGPKKIGRTVFDYFLKRTWDLKVHSINPDRPGKGACLLNDAFSIDQAVKSTGLGLIVLNGIPFPDLNFTRWHKNFRGGSDSEPKRLLKKSFTSKSIQIFFIPDIDRLEKAKESRELNIFQQGRQPTGEPRNIKYSLNTDIATNSDLLVSTIAIN